MVSVAGAQRREWNAALEDEIFALVAARYAPNLPPKAQQEPRGPETAEEVDHIVEYIARLCAHDTFIVQVCAKAIDRLVSDADFQHKLARQIGDDGHHAVLARDSLQVLTGQDQIDKVEAYTREHWDLMGDLPYRDWFGFAAFQLHYELHIQPRLKAESRTAKLRYRALSKNFKSHYAAEDEAGDELVHRIYVVEWLQKKFAAAAPAERIEWRKRLLDADEEVQRRLNPYLRWRLQNGGLAWQGDTTNGVALYDAHRREVLSYLLETPVDELPALTSLAA
jgi:hypothetical protein